MSFDVKLSPAHKKSLQTEKTAVTYMMMSCIKRNDQEILNAMFASCKYTRTYL